TVQAQDRGVLRRTEIQNVPEGALDPGFVRANLRLQAVTDQVVRDRPVEMPVTTVGPGVLGQIVLDVQGAPGDRLLHLGEHMVGRIAEVEGQLPYLSTIEVD